MYYSAVFHVKTQNTSFGTPYFATAAYYQKERPVGFGKQNESDLVELLTTSCTTRAFSLIQPRTEHSKLLRAKSWRGAQPAQIHQESPLQVLDGPHPPDALPCELVQDWLILLLAPVEHLTSARVDSAC